MTAVAPPAGPGFFGLRASPSRRSCRAFVMAAPGKFSRDIIAASALVELYDEELELEVYRKGIRTEQASAARINSSLKELLSSGIFTCLIGYPSFPASLSEGSAYRQILFAPGLGGEGTSPPELVVGPRRGRPESAGAPKVLTAREIAAGRGKGRLRRLRKVPSLLTVDLRVMEPALFPVRSNIEPGGLGWYPLTGILRPLLRSGGVAAVLVPPCPLPSADGAPAFVAARLVAKILAYALSAD